MTWHNLFGPMWSQDFLLLFSKNVCPNLAPLQDISLLNFSDLEFDPSMSLKVKSNGTAELPLRQPTGTSVL